MDEFSGVASEGQKIMDSWAYADAMVTTARITPRLPERTQTS
jgi:hypothetical protein